LSNYYSNANRLLRVVVVQLLCIVGNIIKLMNEVEILLIYYLINISASTLSMVLWCIFITWSTFQLPLYWRFYNVYLLLDQHFGFHSIDGSIMYIYYLINISASTLSMVLWCIIITLSTFQLPLYWRFYNVYLLLDQYFGFHSIDGSMMYIYYLINISASTLSMVL
jgi:hypothetical protein